MMCAKLIHHAGIEQVIIVDGGFGGENGVGYLEDHGVRDKTHRWAQRPTILVGALKSHVCVIEACRKSRF